MGTPGRTVDSLNAVVRAVGRLGQPVLQRALEPRAVLVHWDRLVEAHLHSAAVHRECRHLVVEPGAVADHPPADARVAHAGEPGERAHRDLERARHPNPDALPLAFLEWVS